jgi:hypothetical protein
MAIAGFVTNVISKYLTTNVNEESTQSQPHSHPVIYDRNMCVIFPVDTFHCVPNYCRLDITDSDARKALVNEYRTANSVCVHWWQCSWQK